MHSADFQSFVQPVGGVVYSCLVLCSSEQMWPARVRQAAGNMQCLQGGCTLFHSTQLLPQKVSLKLKNKEGAKIMKSKNQIL